MATLRKRSNEHWQARVQGHAALSKTFINKVDAERWAKQIEVEMQKGSYNNLVLAERTTFAEIIERYIVEVLPTMRGGKADFIRLKALARRPIAELNMVALTPQKISQHRDERLKEIAPATVIRELSYFSSIITYARKEWGDYPTLYRWNGHFGYLSVVIKNHKYHFWTFLTIAFISQNCSRS